VAICNCELETGYVQKFIINYCQLFNAGNSITLIRIPGHTGIRCNELADEAAKAALSSTVSTMKCPASDFIPELTMHYREVCQAEWDGCSANKLHSVKHHVGYCIVTHLSRRDAVILRRLSMVLRLRQHNIGYTADGFYRSDDPTNSVKALKEGG